MKRLTLLAAILPLFIASVSQAAPPTSNPYRYVCIFWVDEGTYGEHRQTASGDFSFVPPYKDADAPVVMPMGLDLSLKVFMHQGTLIARVTRGDGRLVEQIGSPVRMPFDFSHRSEAPLGPTDSELSAGLSCWPE